MTSKKLILVFIYLANLALVLVLCTFCKNGALPKNKKIFRYNESKNIASLDPAFARNQAAIWPVNQLFNGLVQFNDSLNIKPCIAKSWEVSENGKVYTFHLRSDVYFHQSEVFGANTTRKVNAGDFLYSFNRIIDAKTASPGAWVFNFVDTQCPNSSNGFKALNDSTFQIFLQTPFVPFLGLLTTPYCFVVPREAIDYYQRDFRNHPVGTGPFKFKIWKEGEKLVLVKNENYFEKDSAGNTLPKIDGVAITLISEKQSEFLEFIKGDIDFISGINATFKDELITRQGKLKPSYNSKIKMLTCPYLNTEYIGFNIDTNIAAVKESPIKSRYIRRAMNFAIDRKKMLLYLRNNMGTPAINGFVPKGLSHFSDNDVQGYYYSPDSVRKLLMLAGYPNGKGLPPVKLFTGSDYVDLCEFIQNELNQFGITIEVEVVTGLAYRNMLANSKMQMFRASWIGDYPDAENYLALFYSKNFCPAGPNYSHFKNDLYDNLYMNGLSENNVTKRSNIYAQMDKIIIDNALVIPLYYDMAVRFTKKNIKNLGINPLNLLVLKNVDIE